MKIVYIAGKFRGANAWEEVGFRVAELGAMPLIPQANTRFFDRTLTERFWLDGAMELLRRCDAVMLVLGWPESMGARAEKEEAERLGKPVFEPCNYGLLSAWLAAAEPGQW